MSKNEKVVIGTRNCVQFTFPGEKGEYSFSIPLNSQIDESIKVAKFFVQALDVEKAKAEKKGEKDGLEDKSKD